MVDDIDLLEDRKGNSTSSTDDMDLVRASGGVPEGDNHDSREMQDGVVEEKGVCDVMKLRTNSMGWCTKFEKTFGEGQEELLSGSHA
jgi:hypothetical protein